MTELFVNIHTRKKGEKLRHVRVFAHNCPLQEVTKDRSQITFDGDPCVGEPIYILLGRSHGEAGYKWVGLSAHENCREAYEAESGHANAYKTCVAFAILEDGN